MPFVRVCVCGLCFESACAGEEDIIPRSHQATTTGAGRAPRYEARELSFSRPPGGSAFRMQRPAANALVRMERQGLMCVVQDRVMRRFGSPLSWGFPCPFGDLSAFATTVWAATSLGPALHVSGPLLSVDPPLYRTLRYTESPGSCSVSRFWWALLVEPLIGDTTVYTSSAVCSLYVSIDMALLSTTYHCKVGASRLFRQ